MKIINHNIIAGFVVVLLAMLTLDGCSCGRRHRDRDRERRQERAERSERRSESRGERRGSARLTSYSAEEVQEIAESDDYDKMLSCLESEIAAVRSLKNKYFDGNLSDKQVDEQMKEIEETYAPVHEALEKADSAGELNYKQHKRQMKLFGERLKLLQSVMGRLGDDFENALGI